MPLAATAPGEWICVSLHSTRTVGLGCVNIRAYNFFVCGPKFTDFPGIKLRMSCSWSLNYFSDFRYVDPFRRYSRLKCEVVWNCRGANFACLGPQFIWERAPELLDLHYKAHPDWDHVAKFYGDRPRELGDLMAKKNKTRNIGQSPTWGRPAQQVRLERQFWWFKFRSQQRHLANELRQLTQYAHSWFSVRQHARL